MTSMLQVEKIMAAMRAGKLMDATRHIQAMLGQNGAMAAATEAGPASESASESATKPTTGTMAAAGEVIDLVAEQVTIQPKARAARKAAFEAREFVCAHGSIVYRLHRPAGLAEDAPLLIMLHGCTQTAEDFAAGTRMNRLAEAAGMAVLWPEQSQASNPRRCWRWFEAAHHESSGGEPALLLALAAHVAETEALAPHSWCVAGLSAGGAMAAVLGDCGDSRVAAVAVHSGLAAAAATTVAGGLGAMRQPPAPSLRPGKLVPTLILHGRQDQTVAPGNADALFDQAIARGGQRLRIEDHRTAMGLRTVAVDAKGVRRVERYLIDRAGHAWSGGDAAGSFADPKGPDASRLILDFFAEQRGLKA